MGKTTAVGERAEREALLDEFGELDRQVRGFRPTAERHEALRKIILSWVAAEAAEKAVELAGRLYVVNVGPAGWRRKVYNLARVLTALGKTRFLELANVSVTALDQHLPKELHETCIRWEQTGPRKLVAVAREAQRAA